jgi:hypothetical protein
VRTNELTSTGSWLFQPTLNQAEQSAFKPFVTGGDSTYMWVSPDNHYVVYATQVGTDERATYVAHGSRTTLTTFVTPIWVQSPQYEGSLEVYWSADSSSYAFDISFAPGAATLYHITNLSTAAPTIVSIKSIVINGVEYFLFGRGRWSYVNTIFDISDDGSSVLTHLAAPDTTIERLIVWKPSTPSTSQVILDFDVADVLGARFVEGSSSRIILIKRDGLFAYDLSSEVLTLITPSINAEGYDVQDSFTKRAFFSPNNRWLAVVEPDSRGVPSVTLHDLQVFDLAAQYLSIDPLCSPDPATYRTWRISNPNPTRSDFGWTLVGGDLADQGYGSVPAAVGAQAGEVFLSTRSLGGDATLQVSVNGINQGSSVNTGQQCAAQATPALNLQLVAQCSPLPTAYRVWEVRNPNATAVTFTWELEQYTQRGSGSVPGGTVSTPGKALFLTRTEATTTNVKLFANDVEQASAATSTTQCAR